MKLVLVSIDLFSYVFARVVFLFCSFFLSRKRTGPIMDFLQEHVGASELVCGMWSVVVFLCFVFCFLWRGVSAGARHFRAGETTHPAVGQEQEEEKEG